MMYPTSGGKNDGSSGANASPTRLGPADRHRRFAIRRDLHDTALSGMRRRHIEMP